MNSSKLPALSGIKLNKYLLKDRWIECGQRTHGIAKKKKIGDRTLVTIIPNKRESLPIGTLKAILSNKQTCLGEKGLLKLIKKY